MALSLCLLHSSSVQAAQDADSVTPTTLTRIAFGSCNKQHADQPLWSLAKQLQPQLWLWTGDAVYAKGASDTSHLEGAYAKQLENEAYRGFLETGVRVEGVYDDHDYGNNDAGKELPYKDESLRQYLKFINSDLSASRLRRKGIYSSHIYGDAPHQVKVLLLDTRYHRDSHFIPSLGAWQDPWLHWKVPFGALVAAVLRMFTVYLPFTSQSASRYEGEVLGGEQFEWLEAQLTDSVASVHVVVSSIQVFTSNPLVESWGHFPRAKRRLAALLRETQPRGLVLLSGDVHFGELMGKPADPADGRGGSDVVLEYTSSGMTHTCGTAFWGAACPSILRHFSSHRLRPDAFTTALNFGSIDIDWGSNASAPRVTVRLHSVPNDTAAGAVERPASNGTASSVLLSHSFVADTTHMHAISRLLQEGSEDEDDPRTQSCEDSTANTKLEPEPERKASVARRFRIF